MARGKYVVAASEEGQPVTPPATCGPCPCSPRVCLIILVVSLLVAVAAALAVLFILRQLDDNTIHLADGTKLFRGGPHITEGDMLREDPSDVTLLSAARDRDKLWPEGRIPYRIDATIGCPDTPRCAVLLSAMDEYDHRTCVRWEAATRADQHALTINYQPDGGCYSHVGYRGNQPSGYREQEMVLGNGCFNKGIILHLLGHTLGLWHEHNRPDRDSWLKVNRTNVAQRHQQSFNKFTQSQHHIVDRLDLNSIMMHGSRAYSADGRDITMLSHWSAEPLPEVWHKSQLSARDVDRLQSMYIRQCSLRLQEPHT